MTRIPMMRQTVLIALVCFCCPITARGDGGTVRLSQRHGSYQITVFTSPTPVRAGPVDISVLVQDGGGEPASDVHVVVSVAAADKPRETLTEPATTDTATNKLFRSAILELPAPGQWIVKVAVSGSSGPAEVRFELEAGKPLPRWLTLWPWFLWPAVVVALFGIHQFLVRRKQCQTETRLLRAQLVTREPRSE